MDTGEDISLFHTLREFTALISENMSQTQKLEMQENIFTSEI